VFQEVLGVETLLMISLKNQQIHVSVLNTSRRKIKKPSRLPENLRETKMSLRQRS
jgi:hypothetical protein